MPSTIFKPVTALGRRVRTLCAKITRKTLRKATIASDESFCFMTTPEDDDESAVVNKDTEELKEETVAVEVTALNDDGAVGTSTVTPVDKFTPEDVRRIIRMHGVGTMTMSKCVRWEMCYGPFRLHHLQPDREQWATLTVEERIVKIGYRQGVTGSEDRSPKRLAFVKGHPLAYDLVFSVLNLPHPDDIYRQCIWAVFKAGRAYIWEEEDREEEEARTKAEEATVPRGDGSVQAAGGDAEEATTRFLRVQAHSGLEPTHPTPFAVTETHDHSSTLSACESFFEIDRAQLRSKNLAPKPIMGTIDDVQGNRPPLAGTSGRRTGRDRPASLAWLDPLEDAEDMDEEDVNEAGDDEEEDKAGLNGCS
ncbi:hypothetical protein PUNSTDRAFT_135094 [Punctularia strigosozonata HHB-11173 SS5]|uniref:uncharacterized protein n=1 Tax=Punctularia strigosozonata (strain HHB-11173) TaxID=741275 RepID=UPI00044179F8|nr:uncharacterized protein PUNSTDRAFT_135094 [Punctularia strigosozonata HHB-11173 SS5]EIN07568.1 hypothetical protein PUNSTDRAFT_135094 [Punctularia strigosozonata HHB-11173 SS5]